MAIDKVRAYFKEYGIENKILEFKVSSETVELAALAVGCEPKLIAKSISFLLDDTPILVVIAGDAKVANPKYKDTFGQKAKMIPHDQVLPLIGHDVGGVCPFALNDGVRVYLDVSLKRFPVVYPAAGSGNSAVPLTISELETYSHSLKWVDVCKDWE